MSFLDAVKICFQKYSNFNGRATRAEFWWFYLFSYIAQLTTGLINEYLSTAFTLLTILPILAVSARRLHDINKSGWLQLLWHIGATVLFIISFIGLNNLRVSPLPIRFLLVVGVILAMVTVIIFIILMTAQGDAGENKYGEAPAN